LEITRETCDCREMKYAAVSLPVLMTVGQVTPRSWATWDAYFRCRISLFMSWAVSSQQGRDCAGCRGQQTAHRMVDSQVLSLARRMISATALCELHQQDGRGRHEGLLRYRLGGETPRHRPGRRDGYGDRPAAHRRIASGLRGTADSAGRGRRHRRGADPGGHRDPAWPADGSSRSIR
jgi:hypothetical protein